MTGNVLLNWAALAVSIFNAMVLFWLGLTVWLNARARVPGVWLASAGLLLGALFFVGHTAILGYGPAPAGGGITVWWRLGWLALLVLPLTWYLVALWHTGRWGQDSRLPRQNRGWVAALVLAFGALSGWLLLADPLPSLAQISRLSLPDGFPMFLAVFPAYLAACVGPATVTLARARHAPHIRTDPGRRRAHPWLLGTSAGLVAVTALVTGVIVWAAVVTGRGAVPPGRADLSFIAAGLDLAIAGLIAAATLLLGQAIIAFEVLARQTLPRFEIQRQWRNAVILAAGYGAAAGLGLALKVHPVALVLLSILLMTLFVAMSGWRGHALRQQYLQQLRPFLSSQNLYENLLAASPAEVDVRTPFRALCREILQTDFAQFVPLGPLAPLVPRLNYPTGAGPLPVSPEILARCQSPEIMYFPLESCAPAQWAVPLWSERGLIGLLLLGNKLAGNLFVQEEIEVARATGERLIDTCASAEISRRLMALQRQRLAESRILDRQTRRVLHDEVLPNLHTTLLALPQTRANAAASQTLAETHRQISHLLQQMPADPLPALEKLGLFGAVRRLVTTEFAGWFDAVDWRVEPAADTAAAALPPMSAEVLFYAIREVIRNAAQHGRGGDDRRLLALDIRAGYSGQLFISIEDNGVGVGGPSAGAGSGQGLALHSTMLAIIGGQLKIDSKPGEMTRVTISV